MQSYLRPTDAEAPSGRTQAGLRPGNVQEPLASRAVPHARLEVVASPRHGNPARSHTCTTRTPQTPPVYTGKHSQHAQTTAQDTIRPKKRAAPLKNGKHAAPKPPRSRRALPPCRARTPRPQPWAYRGYVAPPWRRSAASAALRPALTRRRGAHCPPDERSPGSFLDGYILM